MTVNYQKRAIGTFSTHQQAEAALEELRDSGFRMNQISLIGRDTRGKTEVIGSDVDNRRLDDKVDDTEADEGAKKGAITGGTVGGLTGLLVGLGVLAIPGIGPIMLAGAAATALATAITGGAIGAAAGGLIGGLIGLGIPEEDAKRYNDRVSKGEYLLMVEGSPEDIHLAELILNRRGIQDWSLYNYPTTHSVQTSDSTIPSRRELL